MRNYNNYSDMITFTRASSGTALAKISYGPELVTNGTFDTADLSLWTPSAGNTISVEGGRLRVTRDGTINTYGGASTTITGLEIGKTYSISIECIAGTISAVHRIRANISSAAYYGDNRPSGEYTFVSTGTSALLEVAAVQNVSSGYSEFDNISIKEVFYDQPDGTLKLFNHLTNKPRVEYDYQGNRLGLLVEEARTNSVANSNNFAWSSHQTTRVLSGSIPSVDGQNNAWTLTAQASSGLHHLYQQDLSNLTSTVHCYSVFLKAGTHRYAHIALSQSGNSITAVVDLELGIITETYVGPSSGTIVRTSVDNYGNGWFRVSLAGNITATNVWRSVGFTGAASGNSFDSWGNTTFSATGNEVIYIYGAQLEAGSFPTSYIPTAGSTVTRSADVASIGVTNFGYNKTAGTTVVEGVSFGSSNFRYFYSFDDNSGSFNNSSLLFLNTSGVPTYQRLSAGAYVVNTTQSIAYTPGQMTKFAVAETVDDMSFVQDAGDPKVDTAGVLPLGVEKMNIASSPLNNQILNGHISSITYYPRRLTNAQIQKLTSVSSNSTLSLTFDGTSDSYLETNTHG